MRADRLLSILLLLQSRGKMTASELADKLEVSQRTILRDMEALSSAGIPVYAERGASGGWALVEGYKTDLTGLRKEELLSLLLSAPGKALTDLDLRQNFESAWMKLIAALPAALQSDAEFARQRLHVDGAGWFHSSETFPELTVVHEALWTNRKLLLYYYKEQGELSERIVDPLGLVVKNGIWYLVAQYDGEPRSFRISRIRSSTVLNDAACRPPDFDLAAYWQQSTAAFQSTLPHYIVKIKLSSNLLPMLQQSKFTKILSVKKSETGDETVEVTADLQTLENACKSIAGLGFKAEALEPQELRTAILRHAEMLLKLYRSEES